MLHELVLAGNSPNDRSARLPRASPTTATYRPARRRTTTRRGHTDNCAAWTAWPGGWTRESPQSCHTIAADRDPRQTAECSRGPTSSVPCSPLIRNSVLPGFFPPTINSGNVIRSCRQSAVTEVNSLSPGLTRLPANIAAIIGPFRLLPESCKSCKSCLFLRRTTQQRMPPADPAVVTAQGRGGSYPPSSSVPIWNRHASTSSGLPSPKCENPPLSC